MKKRILIALGLIVGLLVAVFAFNSASATEGHDPDKCYDTVVDKAAYDEPAVPAVAEVSHTEYHFAKFTHTKTRPKHGDWSAYGPWTKWDPETHTSWELSDAPLGSPAFHGEGSTGSGNNKVEFYREWQAQLDGQTRKVVDSAAVPGKDAVHHEATYKEVEVPCPPVETQPPSPTPTPTDVPTTEPTPDIGTPVSEDTGPLPDTGAGATILKILGGIAVILIGLGIVYRDRVAFAISEARRKRKQ